MYKSNNSPLLIYQYGVLNDLFRLYSLWNQRYNHTETFTSELFQNIL